MPRYNDEWVVTKSVFEFTTGGSCACCSFPAIFDPNGLKGLINSISDLETDAANEEINAIDRSPWPPDMRDSIWADRVKVRHKMKKEIKKYKEFMEEVGEEKLLQFCLDELGPVTLKTIFQMARSQVTDALSSRYNICPAYGTVMCSVVDQVANFDLTKYPSDGRGPEEIEFENNLRYSRYGGFILDITNGSSNENMKVNQEILVMFINMMKSLGGKILLQRGPSSTITIAHEDEEVDVDADERVNEAKNGNGPSFRSDRRIARLLIARYWADTIISKYREKVK